MSRHRYSFLDNAADRPVVTIRPAGTTDGMARLVEVRKALAELKAEESRLAKELSVAGAAEPLNQCRDRIVAIVARAFGVSVREIMGREKYNAVSRARQAAVVLVMIASGAALKQLGRAFDREHGAVIFARRAAWNRFETDPEFAQLLNYCAAVSGCVIPAPGTSTARP